MEVLELRKNESFTEVGVATADKGAHRSQKSGDGTPPRPAWKQKIHACSRPCKSVPAEDELRAASGAASGAASSESLLLLHERCVLVLPGLPGLQRFATCRKPAYVAEISSKI